ncbi:hypothetical protein C9374_000337 [Naegleria lovaniensis]|uniref:Fe2OG dioxygenase domain-containing protein n=1 Tax=Naegleria lovaniensis TaxID=51637 RepID=A0AA88KP01_NAELO|nr:uncharacterized protein C9374_000337 [Naegleria lovaniensis]KAG2388898.1 hypothetical protein C9374_000337 [Naegleria lovaniensis]
MNQTLGKIFSSTSSSFPKLSKLQLSSLSALSSSSYGSHPMQAASILNPSLHEVPPTAFYHPSFISDPNHLNTIWHELKTLYQHQPFIANPSLKRSIFNVHSEAQVKHCAELYFPTLYSYIQSLAPYFYKRTRDASFRTVMSLQDLEKAKTPNIIPNTIQFNHYQHVEKSGCPLHIDSRGLGPTIGMLSFGNDATMSFLLDPPSNYTIEQVQECPDELRVYLPNGSLIILADDIRYKYVHGIRNEIQKRNPNLDHAERFSVVFWYQD